MNTYYIRWHDIGITIRHTPNMWSIIEPLEVESDNRQQIPITETGYKSHFLSAEELATYGGPIDYVIAWLDVAAEAAAWRDTEERRKQYSLF
jgi:hypothetical protein